MAKLLTSVGDDDDDNDDSRKEQNCMQEHPQLEKSAKSFINVDFLHYISQETACPGLVQKRVRLARNVNITRPR